MVSFYFWTEQIQNAVVVCKDMSLIGIKQFLYFTHQYLEKRISVNRCYQVIFGFKHVTNQNDCFTLHSE